jgi:hypothetical protein
MRRLAPLIAVAVLALRAAPARGEPLDVDLVRLGPPDAGVWMELDAAQPSPIGFDAATASRYATESKQRFAILSSEVALALSSALLHPASTTGHSGFALDLEGSYAGVHSGAVGEQPPLARFSNEPWTTRSATPGSLSMTGLHVRKALPFSFEVGGRLTYLNRSSYFAAQGEVKWALNEGFEVLPDVAVRLAHTRLFGQQDWNLDATDLDFMVSKRWGVNAVTSFTPYAAARFTFVTASSERLDFGGLPDADGLAARNAMVAGFPELRVGLYRTTLGLRMTAYTVSLAVETTYFGGKSHSGEDAPTRDQYGDFRLASAFSGAAKLGWEF